MPNVGAVQSAGDVAVREAYWAERTAKKKKKQQQKGVTKVKLEKC